MKKLLFSFFILTASPIFAINWEPLETPRGNVVYLDRDSIRDVDGYYFYNIKYRFDGRKLFTVVTMQSAHSHPFSSRIKFYSEKEYNELNGDYDNITKNKTENLEPVTFASTVHTCYKRVKTIIETSKNSTITFE